MATSERCVRFLLALGAFAVYAAVKTPKLPDRLLINGQRWEVRWVEELQAFPGYPLAGLTDCKTRTIAVARADQEPTELADTLVHETVHAYLCGPDGDPHNDWLNSSPDGPHPGIEVAAGIIYRLTRDNPEAVEWIRTRRDF